MVAALGREQRSRGRARRLSGPELAKLKERESDRWLEGMTESHLSSEGGQQVIHVMDREADTFPVLDLAERIEANFVIRLRHNRKIEEGLIADALAAQPIKAERMVSPSPRKSKAMPRYTHNGRPARKATLSIRCGTVEIQPPRHMKDLVPIQLQVLQALEEARPEGEKPVSWVLATTLPLRTRSEVERVLDMYRTRWLIEEFHKALKTGCMFERRQLESFESITTLLAMSYPIACELLRVRSRTHRWNTCVRGSEAQHARMSPRISEGAPIIRKPFGHQGPRGDCPLRRASQTQWATRLGNTGG